MNRNSLLDKIRALLSKTQGAGCTEHEALAALDKARAMMDAYEVTEADLQLSKSEAAILQEIKGRDTHGIRRFLASGVAKFCDCKAWRKGDGIIVFCGLPSDAQFAEWLIENLAAFIQGELANHLMGCLAPKGQRWKIINGFVSGATGRIHHRLSELCQQSAVTVSSNSRAMVLVKGAAVAEKMASLNLRLRAGRRSSRKMDYGAIMAGQSAGDRASFGRPVSGSSILKLGKA